MTIGKVLHGGESVALSATKAIRGRCKVLTVIEKIKYPCVV